MSDRDDTDQWAENTTEDLLSTTRRRMLQLTGASVAGLGVAGLTAGTASAATGCADGPFERSYEGGTINFSQIKSDQNDKGTPDDVSAAEPRGGTDRDSSGGPPYGIG